jgi:serine/threonine protein kinase
LHRDIKPGNIYLRDKDNSPVLLDFGAARYEVGSQSRTITATVTPGYAPFEQYQTNSGRQGPWTDIYALGAVLYRLISGNTPIESTKRIGALMRNQPDPLPAAVQVGKGRYPENLLQGIDWALQVLEKDRPQNVAEWSKKLVTAPSAPVFQTSNQTQQFSPQTFSERDVEDFVGISSLSFADHKYYLNAFLQALNGKTWGWSWAGFIFGFLWIAYRKMYLKSFFLTLLVLIQPVIFGFIVQLGCAIYGNYWYYLHFRRVLKNAPAEVTERSQYFAKKGGTSWVAPFVLMLVMIGIVLLIGILVYWAKYY